MVLKIGEIHTKGATVTPSICPYCSVVLNAFYLLVDHPRIYGLPESIDFGE